MERDASAASKQLPQQAGRLSLPKRADQAAREMGLLCYIQVNRRRPAVWQTWCLWLQTVAVLLNCSRTQQTPTAAAMPLRSAVRNNQHCVLQAAVMRPVDLLMHGRIRERHDGGRTLGDANGGESSRRTGERSPDFKLCLSYRNVDLAIMCLKPMYGSSFTGVLVEALLERDCS